MKKILILIVLLSSIAFTQTKPIKPRANHGGSVGTYGYWWQALYADTIHTRGGLAGSMIMVDSTVYKAQFLKNADSTTLRNQFLKNADSTTIKNGLLHESRDIVVDSSMISVNDTIQFFCTRRDIVLDSIKVKCRATTASIVVNYIYGTGASLAGTAIINSPAASTSTTTGTVVTSFDSGSIAVNQYIWFLFPTVTTKPKQVHITFYYH